MCIRARRSKVPVHQTPKYAPPPPARAAGVVYNGSQLVVPQDGSTPYFSPPGAPAQPPCPRRTLGVTEYKWWGSPGRRGRRARGAASMARQDAAGGVADLVEAVAAAVRGR